MLQIVAGRSGSGKTEYVLDEIIKAAAKKEVILIVPEQNSFYNEKRILTAMGAKDAARVKILSFKRLYESVSAEYGKSYGKSIDDGVKSVIMSLAAEEVSDRLVLYSARSKKSDFAGLMLGAINEYKMCAITPEQLIETAEKTNDVRLKQKLKESAAIYSAYEAILGNAYSDPDDDLTRLYEMIEDNCWFSGKTVWFDSFNGFSGQEMKIIGLCIKQAEFVGMTLCADSSSVNDIGSSIFREPDTTLLKIQMLARKYGTEERPLIRLEGHKRFKSSSIAAIEESVFRFDGDCYDIDDGSVKLYEAADEYDEIHQTARDIRKLVRNDKYNYRDILIICRKPEMYRNVIAAEFPKYHIPFFMSNPQPLDCKPLIKLVLSAFEVVHSSFNTESLLALMKTRLTPLSSNEIYTIENYAYMWDIKGSRWKHPFTMNPDGNESETDKEELEKIENIRKKIIEPLTVFADELSGAKTGADMSAAVYKLLERFETAKHMAGLIISFEGVYDEKQIEAEAKIWDTLIGILEKMYDVLKDTALDSRRYYELLKMMISHNSLSDIPRTLDQVIVGTAGNIRNEGQKAVFIIGAHDGVFPAVPTAQGLFSDNERSSLIGLDLPLYDNVYGMSLKEKFNAYAALSLPTDRLFVSRSMSGTNGEKYGPSVIFNEITAILGPIKTRHLSDIPYEELFCTKEQAFEECASRWNECDKVSNTLKKYFREDKEYSEKYLAVKRAADEEPFAINDNVYANKLFKYEYRQQENQENQENPKKQLVLSASQIEKYYKCPFSFFCNYGLKARPRKKTSMNASIFGTAVHDVLENIIRDKGIDGLKSCGDDELDELIKKYVAGFIESIGGGGDRTERFMVQFGYITKNLRLLIKRLVDEFEYCSFVPEKFELCIGGKEQDIPSYELKLADGEIITVAGKVDRVDTFLHNGKKYIRIIDYKTGAKKFLLSDILYGLNIQMLFYLAAIKSKGGELLADSKTPLVPAGILYMPSKAAMTSGGHYSEEQKNAAVNEQKSKFKMNGLLINDTEILDAMEKDIQGIFIPAKRKSAKGADGKAELSDHYSSVVSLEEYGKIFEYVNKKIKEMAESLMSGKIERRPVKGSEDACKSCDYKTVCGYEKGKNSTVVRKYSPKNALELMGYKADENNAEEEKK